MNTLNMIQTVDFSKVRKVVGATVSMTFIFFCIATICYIGYTLCQFFEVEGFFNIVRFFLYPTLIVATVVSFIIGFAYSIAFFPGTWAISLLVFIYGGTAWLSFEFGLNHPIPSIVNFIVGGITALFAAIFFIGQCFEWMSE